MKPIAFTVKHPAFEDCWNGYVAVPPSHCVHGMDYDDIHFLYEVSVHGGLTFSDTPDHLPIDESLFQIPEGWWVVGFDTLHFNDRFPRPLLPGGQRDPVLDGVYERMGLIGGGRVWSEAEVMYEANLLRIQLIEIDTWRSRVDSKWFKLKQKLKWLLESLFDTLARVLAFLKSSWERLVRYLK